MAAELFVFVHGLHVRMRHLESAIFAYNACGKPSRARLQTSALVRGTLKECQGDFTRSVGKRCHESASASANNTAAYNFPDDDGPFANVQVSDRTDLGLVQVGARNIV